MLAGAGGLPLAVISRCKCAGEADVVKCAKIRLELFVAEFCSGPALTATTLRNTSARKPPVLAASGPCKTLASKLGTRLQPFEYRSVR